MQAKSVLYAAVGIPVVAARKLTDQVNGLKDRVSKETTNYTEAANKAFDEWAAEGEKVVARISEGKVVEEFSSKVDLDQAKEQVGKLRDQLEDILATWRASFRPETAEEKTQGKETEAEKAGAEAAAKSTTTRTTANKPAAKTASKSTADKTATKTSAGKTTKSSSTAKKSTGKSTTSESKAS